MITPFIILALMAAPRLVNRTRAAGWAAAAVLVLFFPANIYAAFAQAPMGAHAWGPVYLLFRGPLQAAIVLWVWWFVLRQPDARVKLHA